MVSIHPTKIALAPNSEAIEGSFTFIEELRKVLKMKQGSPLKVWSFY
jgi:hypothetical protein